MQFTDVVFHRFDEKAVLELTSLTVSFLDKAHMELLNLYFLQHRHYTWIRASVCFVSDF